MSKVAFWRPRNTLAVLNTRAMLWVIPIALALPIPAKAMIIQSFRAEGIIGVPMSAGALQATKVYTVLDASGLSKLGNTPVYEFSKSYNGSSSFISNGSVGSGRSALDVNLLVQPGVIKATNQTDALAEIISRNTRNQIPTTISGSSSRLSLSTLDRLIFQFSDPLIQTAQVKITLAARVSSLINVIGDTVNDLAIGGHFLGFWR